ncbi:exonuclease 3'-5' domain-containing protein 2 [Uranotaenia lowii]|uniref:exonuclease 3'-5' domain-containing protein 2 n=1 Tax=Uranotaenia lowii TaxID=190385 RepID=UPI002479CFCC|nr:exonuclease 3'-5' domain-containing protein 2 [Uranotaenia lowii]
MVLTDRQKTIATSAVAAAVGVGTLYLLYNRKKLWSRFTDPLYGQSIHVVSSWDECRKVVGTLRNHCQEFRVLGFDCEWVNEQGNRHPVALLQLATHRGMCALIRLCDLRRIPPELGDLLNDPAILKVGVGSVDDAKLLRTDYNLKVESTLDLRFMADRCGLVGPYGMAKLAERVLGISLDKHWRIRASNWEQPELTERQLVYAAKDAHVAVELFRSFAKQMVPKAIWTNRKKWVDQVVGEVDCFLDQRFQDKSGGNRNGNGSKKSKKKLLEAKNAEFNLHLKRTMATRAKPLYDNCMMQAPDGEVLCTCDRKKAEWYVLKELAEIVPDQPNYTIRLKFEPKGRAVGEVGQYYQMAKENRCVVCGEKNSYIRKNVVPRDYRKHFPLVMKEHTSHDVLLLCVPCHRTSNMSDDNMRLKLAAICSAPYTSKENPKEVRVESMNDLRKIARALLFGTQIPEERRRSLEGRMRKLLPRGTEITKDLLDTYANISTCVPNEDYFSHGQKVADYYRIQPGGLSELERMWREHFLRTMKPKFLPELWSVEHNYKRLEIKAEEGRVNEEDLQQAGVPRSTSKPSAVSTPSTNASYSVGSTTNGNETTNEDPSSSSSDTLSFPTDSTNSAKSHEKTNEVSSQAAADEETVFYSNRDELRSELTNYQSAALGVSTVTSSTTLANDRFRTVMPDFSASEGDGDDGDEEGGANGSEPATVNDFASIDYDSDDSDSTLSQPSMTTTTLADSTDDWEAELNDDGPSVNGNLSFSVPSPAGGSSELKK